MPETESGGQPTPDPVVTFPCRWKPGEIDASGNIHWFCEACEETMATWQRPDRCLSAARLNGAEMKREARVVRKDLRAATNGLLDPAAKIKTAREVVFARRLRAAKQHLIRLQEEQQNAHD